MFDEENHSFKDFIRENRVGLYTTISVHLFVIIVLLLYQINDIRKVEVPFVLDFSKQEEQQMLVEKQERHAHFEKELDEMLAPVRHQNQSIRNAAVDETEQVLRDDRHSNPTAIYDEARRVQESLDAARAALQQEQGTDDLLPVAGTTPTNKTQGGNHKGTVTAETPTNKTQSESYKGPSVLSYNLGGRKAMHLPVPVYQCRGGGDVTVRIEVDRRGYVTATAINTENSTANTCLHEAAQRAARTSRFAVDAKAPDRQQGHIVYRFIAQ